MREHTIVLSMFVVLNFIYTLVFVYFSAFPDSDFTFIPQAFYFHSPQPTFPFAISFHTLSWKQFDNNKLLSQFAFGSSSRKKDCFLLVKTLKTLPLFAVALACNTTLYRLCTALVLGFDCVLIHAVVN